MLGGSTPHFGTLKEIMKKIKDKKLKMKYSLYGSGMIVINSDDCSFFNTANRVCTDRCEVRKWCSRKLKENDLEISNGLSSISSYVNQILETSDIELPERLNGKWSNCAKAVYMIRKERKQKLLDKIENEL